VSRASLVDRDPDLFADLDGDALAQFRPRIVVEVSELSPGSWDAPAGAARDRFGLLVLDGLLSLRSRWPAFQLAVSQLVRGDPPPELRTEEHL